MRQEDMLPIKVIVGSLIVSPLLTKEENLEKFNEWIKETYEDI